MAVLLTGATGFVGLNIAHALLARGEKVVLFAPAPPPEALAGGSLADACFVAGDIRVPDSLDRAFAAQAIDRVIHAAALTPDAQAEAERPDVITEVNLGGTVRLMQAAHRAGVRRVLGLSSVAVYGYAAPAADGRLHEESTPPQPAALYGITKLAAEQAIHRLGALYGIETLTVRLGPCFGAREHATGVRPLLSPHWQCAEAARAGRDCVLPRPMAADWIDVEEAAGAIADLLAVPSPPHRIFNLGGSALTTAAAWCEALASLHPGFRWRIDAGAPTVRYGLERDRAPMETGRLRAAIGRAPFTKDLAGIARRYLAWRNSPEGIALCGA
ncbi:NAD-dependent epimerase/dehydratase family protein [Roseomonas populi]|uniref:NAD(P)-dependent oxidoreductase n=1 Tax=Roseomonas populi TaxID=3121582 RepID=A0ABT1X3C6_9PROT|nr:NAD(P)-dependent oxidoreductase [Roseomonas pecuniae]MCR0982605.1 NAD(P)-dependent oxidoreductase [Roseomonas pecuniae]